MIKILFRKMLVMTIIILLIGISIAPAISGNNIKTNVVEIAVQTTEGQPFPSILL